MRTQRRPAGKTVELTMLSQAEWREAATGKLARLLRLNRDHRHETNAAGCALLDRAIFVAVSECRDAGAATAAHQLVEDFALLAPVIVRKAKRR